MNAYFISLFSESRFAVLRVLHYDRGGVSLREIALRAGLSVGAVQTSLKSLLRCGLVTREKVGQRVLFQTNSHHPDFCLLIELFGAEERQRIAQQAEQYSRENKALLERLDDMHRFAHGLRSAVGETRRSL
jgi:predicted transcriptional regulator